MKSGQIRTKEETDTHQSSSPAGNTGEDEDGRPMRILIAIQGYYGERMVDNIKRHAPANWEVNHFTLTAGLPNIVDDTDEFLPEQLSAADLLISLGSVISGGNAGVAVSMV